MDKGQAERLIAAECVVSFFVVTIARIREQKKAPTPAQLAGVVVAFLFLGAAAMFGNRAARIAAALGSLIVLNELMRHYDSLFGGVSGLLSGGGVKLDAAAVKEDASYTKTSTTQSTQATTPGANDFSNKQTATV